MSLNLKKRKKMGGKKRAKRIEPVRREPDDDDEDVDMADVSFLAVSDADKCRVTRTTLSLNEKHHRWSLTRRTTTRMILSRLSLSPDTTPCWLF